MNARVKAIWNLSIGISVLILLFSGFQLFNLQEEMSNLELNFENEEIGTDKILQKNIEKLEMNLKNRDEFKFNIEDSPTDLTNVVQFDGFDPRFSQNSKHIYVTGIINSNIAIGYYREDAFKVMKGDSVAGGLITDITTKEVHFEKSGKEFVFYKGLETEILE